MKPRLAIQFLALTVTLGWLTFALVVSRQLAIQSWTETLPDEALPAATIWTQFAGPYVSGSGCLLSLIGFVFSLRTATKPHHLDVLFATLALAVLVYTGMHILSAFMPWLTIVDSVSA